MKSIFWSGLFAAAVTVAASAAPVLQLLQTGPTVVSVAQGANGNATVDAKNGGTGTLSLQVTGSAPFLVPTVGAAHACSDGSGPGCLPVQIALQTASLARGSYTGFVTVYDPNATDAPQIINVTAQVGTGVPDKLEFYVLQGGSASARVFTTASGLVTATSSNQGLISVAQDGGTPFSPSIPYKVTVNAGSLALGDYTGSVTIAGSTVTTDNKTIPVTIHVIKQSLTGPLASLGGALNNATYAVGESLAQGDIAAVFGSQFLTGSPAQSGVPLSTNVSGVQVFLNDQPVPLYYVSAGQVNFQVPFNAQIGPGTLRVESNGQRGNTISVTIAKAVPRILRLGGDFKDYGIVTNPDVSLTIPSALGGRPPKVGDAIVIYAIGFGPASPAVDSGATSPSAEPFARLTNHPKVCFTAQTPFSAPLCVDPLFAGLAPGFIGLYQINVVIPQGSPTGDIVPIRVVTDDGDTNTVNIAVQQQ